jgi:ABC-type nitrate/sulfonate/bicarbonate transport system substrate-binding protein
LNNSESMIRRGTCSTGNCRYSLSKGSHSAPHGDVDFGRDFAPSHVLTMNAGAPITVLAGLHPGCFEIFGNKGIHSITDLKGKTVGVFLGYNNVESRS